MTTNIYFYNINLCIHPANERWRYSVTPSLIGWTHIQNDPCAYLKCDKSHGSLRLPGAFTPRHDFEVKSIHDKVVINADQTLKCELGKVFFYRCVDVQNFKHREGKVGMVTIFPFTG